MRELYLFNYNSVYYGFKLGIRQTTFQGQIYEPTPIKRSSIKITGNSSKSEVTFTFSRTNTFAKNVLNTVAEVPLLVTIYRDNNVYWTGRVIKASADMITIKLECDNIFSLINREGKVPRVTLHCRHRLYDSMCKLDKEQYKYQEALQNVTSKYITLSQLNAPDNYYSSGLAQLNGQWRYIVSQIGKDIQLEYNFSGTQNGIITVYAGCALTTDDCINKFNNLANFGGCTHLPATNIFTSKGAF